MLSSLFTAQLSVTDAARLLRIERKLDLVLSHMGVDFSKIDAHGLHEDVRSLADSVGKIAAIKKHRELTGASLVEAKDAVEAYMATRGA